MKVLSVIIPAFNEQDYIGPLLEKIITINIAEFNLKFEIIVVDDFSTDNTVSIVEHYCNRYPNIKLIRQLKNNGKGAAVQTGFKASTGDWLLVQDADLEYNPDDYLPMLRKLNGQNNLAIYGSRTLGVKKRKGVICKLFGKHPEQKWGPWLAGRILSFWTFLFYGIWLTDTLTAYKLYPSKTVKLFNIKTNGFETDHELTAKLIAQGVDIKEVPIGYQPRSVEEGKKIKSSDFFIALFTLIRFKFQK